jgi:hypothetical protein
MAALRSRRVSLLALAVLALVCAAVARHAFVGSAAPSTRAARGSVSLAAEASSTALVKVTEENKATTASVLGFVAGILTGGVWVGAAAFAASSYLSRKDDDVSTALKGIAATGLEAVNFGAYLSEKYEVSDKVGSAFDSVLESNPEAKKSVSSAWDGISEAYETIDKDVGIKDTLGTILISGSELAQQAVQKAVDLNEQYKITDQIGEKVSEAIDQAQSSTAKKA